MASACRSGSCREGHPDSAHRDRHGRRCASPRSSTSRTTPRSEAAALSNPTTNQSQTPNHNPKPHPKTAADKAGACAQLNPIPPTQEHRDCPPPIKQLEHASHSTRTPLRPHPPPRYGLCGVFTAEHTVRDATAGENGIRLVLRDQDGRATRGMRALLNSNAVAPMKPSGTVTAGATSESARTAWNERSAAAPPFAATSSAKHCRRRRQRLPRRRRHRLRGRQLLAVRGSTVGLPTTAHRGWGAQCGGFARHRRCA